MIGKYLKAIRKARGMTQDDLAKASGISPSSIKQWELDNTEPNARGLCILADVLDCSIDYLVGRSEVFKIEQTEPDINAEVKRYEDYLRGLSNEIQGNSPKI
jgi:transcriptional regulator with XRE-family HTH domain